MEDDAVDGFRGDGEAGVDHGVVAHLEQSGVDQSLGDAATRRFEVVPLSGAVGQEERDRRRVAEAVAIGEPNSDAHQDVLPTLGRGRVQVVEVGKFGAGIEVCPDHLDLVQPEDVGLSDGDRLVEGADLRGVEIGRGGSAGGTLRNRVARRTHLRG